MPAIGAVSTRAVSDVFVDLQAAFGGERFELQLRILVGGADPGVSDPMFHRSTVSKLVVNGML